LYVSLFTISLNIVLAFWLGSASSYGLQGLAIAQSIVAGVEVCILAVIMVIRDHKLFDGYFWSGVFRTVSVTGFSLVAGYITVGFVPLGATDRGFITLGTKLFILTTVTLTTHLLVSGLFGLEEARPFWRWARKLLYRPVKVEY
jgi:hypothetical protein